jgi:hypothetical protein
MERTGTDPKARKMIGLNFQTKSFLKTSVFGAYTRVPHKTLIHRINEYMGFQWVLFVATVVYVYELKGGPCVHRITGICIDGSRYKYQMKLE